MILHHVPFSRSTRVLWMLEELGLEAEIKTYSIRQGTLRVPEYLEKNPLGRVPALEWGDQVICESGAIIQMLAEAHPEAGLDRPAGHPERARYLEIFGFAETMANQIEALNMQHLFLRDPAQASVTVMKLNTARLRATLGVFEKLLEGRDFVLASGLSAADVMMAYNLLAAPYFVKLDEFPRVRAYVARVAERPAFQRAMAKDGEQDFYTQDFYPLPEAKA